MSLSYTESINQNQYNASDWGVEVAGNDFTSRAQRIEFEEEVNAPVSFNVLIGGVEGDNSSFLIDKEIKILYEDQPAIVGVVDDVNKQSDQVVEVMASGYASELDGNLEDLQFKNTNTDAVVTSLVDGSSTATGKTIQTGSNDGSFPFNERLNASTDGVVDFRANKNQLKDVTRLVGEYSGEWYIGFDSSLNPKFNVVSQRGGGTPVKTFSTVRGETKTGDSKQNNAKLAEVDTDSKKGSFEQVVVYGYGDGDDQIRAVADSNANIVSSPSSDTKTLVYTDKTIISQRQAEKRAVNLAETHTATWITVNIVPSNPNEVFQIGEVVKVDDEKIGVFDDTGDQSGGFRIVKRHYKVNLTNNDVEARLTLSNKPATFMSDFKEAVNETESQTQHMQGARNVWGDKEAANATNAEPLTIDFEVPKDVVDIADKNRLSRVEFNYACTSYRQSGDPQTVTASNFDPGTKVIGGDVDPAGVKMERSNIKNHEHAVGSSTSFGATGRGFLSDSGGFSFTNTVPSSGWVRLGGQVLGTVDPEEDLQHRIKIDISSISSTTNLHYAVLSSNPVANFRFDPESPTAGESVFFEDTTTEPEFGGTVQEWRWDFGDGNTTTITSSPGDTTHSYSSSGSYTVTLEVYDGNSNLLDSVSKTVDVLSASTFSSHIAKVSEEELTPVEVEKNNVSGEEIVAQDNAGWSHSDPDDGETFWMEGGDDVTVEFQSFATDSGETSADIEFFLQKENDTNFFEFQNEDANVNVDTTHEFQTFLTFDQFDDYPFGDDNYSGGEGDTAAGPEGEYSWSYRYTDSQDVYIENVDRFVVIATSEVEDISANVNPDNDDKSEVKFDVEGWAGGSTKGGEYIDTIELYVDGSLENTWDVRGSTADIEEGTSGTLYVGDGQDSIEVVDVIDFDTVEVDRADVLSGTTTLDEGEVVYDTAFQSPLFYGCKHVVDSYDIIERDGSDFNTDFSGAVFETYLDTDQGSVSYKNNGYSDGSHSYEFRFVDNNSTVRDSDSGSFTINLNDPPTADFSFSPTNPGTFETVSFTDQSTDPDGDGTITKWEWDFGDGTTQTINSSPGDTTHSYSSSGTFTVKLTVTDDAGASDSVSKNVTVGQTDVLENTVEMSSADSTGSSTSTVSNQVVSNANTAEMSSASSIGTQTSPANDSFMVENITIPYRDMSGTYEVYIASQGGGSPDITGNVTLQQINHVHDLPRQDDFGDTESDVGPGAEKREVEYVRSPNDRGDVLLDFSTNNEQITLDTTLNGNDVKVTVGNIDSDGNLSNTEQISANNGVVTSATSYQDDELFVRIDTATDKQDFELRDQSGDDVYTLAAARQERFRSSSTEQKQEGVSDDQGTSQDVIEDVSAELLAGSTADNVQVFIDDEPDTGSSSERDITGALYNGASDSGKSKDKELSINQSFSIVGVDTGSEFFSVSGDQTSYMQSGDNLRVTGSTGNDGDYTVSSVSYDSNNDETDITVNEDVTDSTADGNLEWRVVNDAGWYRLKIKPNQASFIKSRVFLDHHKDTNDS